MSEYRFHQIYSSGMVMQRGKPLVFAGTATPGLALLVSFMDMRLTVTAGADGEWTAEFSPLEAWGGPYMVAIQPADGSGKAIELLDVWIGDVWFCSGQSNMEMPLDGGREFWRCADYENEIASADYPLIRYYDTTVIQDISPREPRKEALASTWKRVEPGTIRSFSACAYFFGRKMHQDLGIPIGLISAAWGGTRIEPWISEEALERDGHDFVISRRRHMLDNQPDSDLVRRQEEYRQVFRKWLEKYFKYAEGTEETEKLWLSPDYREDGEWQEYSILKDKFRYVGTGIFRYSLQVPEEFLGQDLTISMGTIDDAEETYVNGVKIGQTREDNLYSWNTPRHYRIPAGLLHAGENLLAVKLLNFYNFGIFNPLRDGGFELKTADGRTMLVGQQAWHYRVLFQADVAKIGTRPESHILNYVADPENPSYPCTLFNSMVAPWVKFPIRGVIWYQGCSNSGEISYYKLHKTLIDDWRRQWQDPDMPFVITQLAGYDSHSPYDRPPEEAWKTRHPLGEYGYALTREIQREIYHNIPNVGMAVAIDIGDQYDIHPARKQPLGYRLACEAERLCGFTDKVTQGPDFTYADFRGTQVIVHFENAEGGLCTDGGQAPGAFELAGQDGLWHQAETRIDGETVVASCAEVPEPCAVRYAFCTYRGDVNLKNREGFAAVPFRSCRRQYEPEC